MDNTRSWLCWYLQEPRYTVGPIGGKLHMCVMEQVNEQHQIMVVPVPAGTEINGWVHTGKTPYIGMEQVNEYHQVIVVLVPAETQIYGWAQTGKSLYVCHETG